MVSKTDLKLILELQKNGRATYAEMASRLGISISTAAARTERLLREKIIEIKALPNPYKIGMIANAMIAIQAEPSKIDHVCDHLVSNFSITTVLTVFGRYDILINVSFQTWEDMHGFINQGLARIDGVLHVDPYFIKDYIKRYEGLFGKAFEKAEQVRLKKEERKLIEFLVQNGRINFSEISEKLGAHVSTVSRRINALINEDIIKIVAVPNPPSFGIWSNAFIVLDAKASQVDQICADLFPFPEIVTIANLITGSGIIVGIHCRNNEVLYKFVKEKIAQIEDIKKTETFISAEIKKRFYGWFLDEKMEYLNF
jgi:Lrp/AsnC family transcriptional regulator for asnA, asnC and gidA